MTRLGDFLSFLGTIFLTTVTQIFGNFLASFEIHHFLIKIALSTFWATIGRFWLLCIPTSGHTGGVRSGL